MGAIRLELKHVIDMTTCCNPVISNHYPDPGSPTSTWKATRNKSEVNKDCDPAVRRVVGRG